MLRALLHSSSPGLPKLFLQMALFEEIKKAMPLQQDSPEYLV